MLLKAGADPNSAHPTSLTTPLHLAATVGCAKVMAELIVAGANLNSRLGNGETSLLKAAFEGKLVAVKILLCMKANPLLTGDCVEDPGTSVVPLDMAARNGHVEVVRELIQELGIEGCGGGSGGEDALEFAAENRHVEIMELLTSAGVIDAGEALVAAAQFGCQSSVKFLLQQRKEKNLCECFGVAVWYAAIGSAEFSTSKIVRMLVDAGTDTGMDTLFESPEGEVLFDGTPLAFTNKLLREK